MRKFIKPLPKDTAFRKGVEYFSEIFLVYAGVIGVSFYEVKKAQQNMKQVKVNVTELKETN